MDAQPETTKFVIIVAILILLTFVVNVVYHWKAIKATIELLLQFIIYLLYFLVKYVLPFSIIAYFIYELLLGWIASIYIANLIYILSG